MYTRQHILISAFVFSSLLVLMACARLSPQVPEGAAPAPAQPGTRVSWEVEWQQTLVEARKEGRVVVYGPPGSDIRKVLTEEFQKAFPGIEVLYTGVAGAQTVPKIKAERRAGIYMADIHIGGTTSIITELKPFALPVEPWLVLPEVKDSKYWVDGRLDFADVEGKYNLVFTVYGKVAMVYNTALLGPAKVKEMSYWDLTSPEFKGKLVMNDPRAAGPGQATALFYYLEPKLGREFLKALAANELIFTRDDRLMMEWVSRGKYMAALGHSDLIYIELVRGGLPNIRSHPVLKEGTFAPNGFGSIIFLDKLPHPSAAKVYSNWLLSKEGQTLWTKATSHPSLRVDVPKELVDPEIILKPGISYLRTYKEEVILKRAEALETVYEIFGRNLRVVMIK